VRRRSLWVTPALIAAFALPCQAANAQAPSVPPTISTQPELVPRFSPSVYDYVTRCGPDGSVSVSVDAPPHAWVFVGRRLPRTGVFSTTVSLAEGQRFAITVFGPGWRVSTYHVRCLPPDFPSFTSQRTGATQAQWYVVAPFSVSPPNASPPNVSPNYVAIFDANGVPVWWYRSTTQALDAKLLANGHIGWLQYNQFEMLQAGADEHRLDGSLVRHADTVDGGADHHELLLLRNGNYLLARYPVLRGVDLRPCGGPADAAIYDNELQEVTPNGSLVWSWRASDHLTAADVAPRWTSVCTETSPADIFHFNSAEPDRSGYVLSLRHLDAVLRIDRVTGAVEWKLGGTPSTTSLSPVGDPAMAGGGFAGQHDARILRDGTLTVHDNGTRAARPPRAVRYRLDLRARTATLIEDIRDSAAPESFCCGSARRLAGGNWVTSWGGQPFITELTPAGVPVFRLTFTQGMFSYRADPVPFGRLRADALRRAMDQMQRRTGP